MPFVAQVSDVPHGPLVLFFERPVVELTTERGTSIFLRFPFPLLFVDFSYNITHLSANRYSWTQHKAKLIVVITTMRASKICSIWRITRIYLKYVKDTAKFEQFHIFIATVTVLNRLLHYLNVMTCFYTMFAVLTISCGFNLQNSDLFRGTSVHLVSC